MKSLLKLISILIILSVSLSQRQELRFLDGESKETQNSYAQGNGEPSNRGDSDDQVENTDEEKPDDLEITEKVESEIIDALAQNADHNLDAVEDADEEEISEEVLNSVNKKVQQIEANCSQGVPCQSHADCCEGQKCTFEFVWRICKKVRTL